MAESLAGSTRPPRPRCSLCWPRPWRPAGRLPGPRRSSNSAGSGRTAGSTGRNAVRWRTALLAGHRCMGCWPPRRPRSWPCSRSGPRSTAPTASWPTAAPTWVGSGPPPPRCDACLSLRINTFGRFRGRAGHSGDRSRCRRTTPRTRFGSTTRPASPGPVSPPPSSPTWSPANGWPPSSPGRKPLPGPAGVHRRPRTRGPDGAGDRPTRGSHRAPAGRPGHRRPGPPDPARRVRQRPRR